MKILTLREVADRYFEEHDHFLSKDYQGQILDGLSVYQKFLGTTPTTEHLTPALLNSFISSLKEQGRKPRTIKHRRNSLLCLWKYAYSIQLTDEPPRAKRVIIRPSVPECWTPDEIVQLLVVMAKDHNTMSNKISRGAWFTSLSLCLYSTGLRLADLLSVKVKEIDPENHSILVLQGKTQRLVKRFLDPRGIALVMNEGSKARELVWDLPYNRTWVYKHFKKYAKQTGLEGTTRFLRRSSATQVCQKKGVEEARRFLDHRSVTTLVNHYLGSLDSFEHEGPERLDLPSS